MFERVLLLWFLRIGDRPPLFELCPLVDTTEMNQAIHQLRKNKWV